VLYLGCAPEAATIGSASIKAVKERDPGVSELLLMEELLCDLEDPRLRLVALKLLEKEETKTFEVSTGFLGESTPLVEQSRRGLTMGGLMADL